MENENPLKDDRGEPEETLDQEASRKMIEEAQKMSSAEISGFSLQVYKRILDPQMQQETFDTLIGMAKEKIGKGPYEKPKIEEAGTIAKRIAGRVDDTLERMKRRNEKAEADRKKRQE